MFRATGDSRAKRAEQKPPRERRTGGAGLQFAFHVFHFLRVFSCNRERWLIMSRTLLSVFLLFFVTACATSPEGRPQLMAPTALQGFSAVYSEFDMQLQLVTATDSPACPEEECVADRAFDQRILAIGRRLAEIAFRQNAELYLRLPRFEFIVANKVEPGAASSAGGTVIVYRGLQRMNLDDAVLAFVLAREMSHVIAGHHDENVAASILVAVAAQILFPVLNIGGLFVGGAATAAAGSTAGSAVGTTAVTSAASFLGSRAIRAGYRPLQMREAEFMALKLLVASGWDGIEVSEKLETLRPSLSDETAWTRELRESAQSIASMMQGPPLPDLDMGVGQIIPGLPISLPPPLVSKPF
ncbi:MAG: hypothetical protein FIA96_16435 [Betaproteobacteria bacterium]|nr:hypothetical protein [Betaproteobacteria bacterium]